MSKTSNRIVTKDIFDKMMETAKPEPIIVETLSLYELDVTKRFARIGTALNKKTKAEVLQLMSDAFDKAAEKIGVSVDSVKFYNTAHNCGFKAERPETEEEMVERIRLRAEAQASALREKKAAEAYKERMLKQKLAQLQKELNRLQKKG